MGTMLIPLLAGGLLLGSQAQDQQKDARALLKQAIEAHSETYQGKRLASQSKMAGKFEDALLKSTIYRQPSGPLKTVGTVVLKDKELSLTSVYNGIKGWVKIAAGDNVFVQEFQPTDYEDAHESAYLDRIGFMVDLLKDPAFVLSFLGKDRFADREVLGVLVTSKGHPDVRVYFDKTTNLMAGMRYKKMDRKAGKEVVREVVFSDYRDLGLSASDRDSLKRAAVALDGAAARAYLRKLIPTKAEQEALLDWIAKLGNPAFNVRERATEQLKKGGVQAIPYLRQAAKNPDKEVVRRAELCLQTMETEGTHQVVGAAIRLIGYARPPGAVEGLLDYLPHAQEEKVAWEVKAVLAHLAQDGGKPPPILVQALQAKEDWLRNTAAAVLGRDSGTYLNKPGRPIFLSRSKYPARTTHYDDGKLVGEEQTLELRYFNRFDDAMFSEPK